VAEIDLNKADKRTVERYIRMGLIDEKAWEKHLKSLPDAAEKAQSIESTLVEGEDDDEGDEDTE